MRQVWICDFCTHREESIDRNKMINHEESCVFNPANKKCYTCAHHESSWDWSECKIHDCYHYMDVQDDDKVCEDWEHE